MSISRHFLAGVCLFVAAARDCAEAVRAKITAGDRSPIDVKALAAKSESYHRSMLRRPLVDMRPVAPRTEAAFRGLMRELSGYPLFRRMSGEMEVAGGGL